MHDRPTEKRLLARRLLLLAASLAVGAVVWFMLGESETITAAETPSEKALARVNGTPITEKAVLDAIAGQLIKLRRDRHDLITRTVETEVRNALIAGAAEERGVSREELIEAEVNGKLAEVPAEEVDAFYEARKQQIRAPKEQVEERIRTFIRYEGYVEELKAAAKIEILTEPFRVEVAAAGPRKGKEDAPIIIVEFSDFECPFCSRVNPSIHKIQETYGDKVQIVFRQFPLEIHKNARKAGEASLCADEQGKFWEMHDGMFGEQKNLAGDGLKSIAAKIEGLDTEAFGTCLDSGKFADAVQKDFEAGAKAGVNSTPAFFINGRYLSGAQPFESFAEVIDDELSRGGSS